MQSTMVLRTNVSGCPLGMDAAWRACNERLVTIAEADALKARVDASRLPDAVSRRK